MSTVSSSASSYQSEYQSRQMPVEERCTFEGFIHFIVVVIGFYVKVLRCSEVA